MITYQQKQDTPCKWARNVTESKPQNQNSRCSSSLRPGSGFRADRGDSEIFARESFASFSKKNNGLLFL